MLDSLFFSGFDPLHEVPEFCNLCSLHPPIFNYDYRAHDKNGDTRKTTGFCCAACAAGLLKKLERAESQEWAAEESALRQDNFDVTELHQHRLASFPHSRKS